MNRVFADLPVTIFEAMSQLARDNDAINLGQGFPDDPGPEDIRRAAADASINGYNQYPSMMGIPELRRAIAAHYGRWHGLSLDPATEVMVTSGGTEALTSAILAVVEPGDEVIVFQPVYDSYLPIIRQAGGIPRLLRLEPPDWRLTEEMLQSAFNRKTKAVLFDDPLNPAAVVYPREDLELLARFCREFDAIAICDEVWEHVIFDGREHIPLITIPGMRDRTIKAPGHGPPSTTKGDAMARDVGQLYTVARAVLEAPVRLRLADRRRGPRERAPIGRRHPLPQPHLGARLASSSVPCCPGASPTSARPSTWTTGRRSTSSRRSA